MDRKRRYPSYSFPCNVHDKKERNGSNFGNVCIRQRPHAGFLHSQFNQDNDEEPDLSNAASLLQTSDGPARTPKEKLHHRLKKLEFKKDEHRISTETVLMKIIGSENHSYLM